MTYNISQMNIIESDGGHENIYEYNIHIPLTGTKRIVHPNNGCHV